MNKVKEFFKKRRAVLSIAIALLLVAAVGAGFGISAKYRKDISIPGKLIIDAGLARRVAILEHQSIRADDGTYTLNTDRTVDKNEFIVIPGVDMPRDPFVKIEGKTEVPAYLYIEVVNTDNITYTLTSDWTELSDVTGKNNGKVYSYKEALTNANTPEAIAILTGSISAGEGEGALSFYPYMVKTEEGKTPAECFDASFISAGTVGTYTPGKANAPDIARETDGTVDVGNEDDQSVYVRAAVVVNWKMEDGSFFGANPVEGTDYTFTSGDDWFKASDGFYYFSNPVPAGQEAPDLIKLFTPVDGAAPEGCTLSVTVSVQTVQAAGGAVHDEWGCTVDPETKAISK